MEDAEKTVNADQNGAEEVVVEEKVETNEEIDFSKVEPEVRKRPIDYIEERRARRAERPQPEVEKPFELEDGEADELDPKVRKIVEREVRESLKPFVKVSAEQANRQEVREFLADPANEHFKRYQSLAEKYMATNEYSGVPAKKIFFMLDYEYSQERGAEQATKRIAQSRARGGETSRPSTRKPSELSADDIARLSPQQALELQRRLAQGDSIQTQA